MTFKYREAAPGVLRPLIEIFTRNDEKFAIYTVMVDSGADYCVFSKDLAEALEIKLLKRNQVKFLGVAKTTLTGYWANIQIRVGIHSYVTKVIFANIHDFGYGLLGQKGFFDHFDVCLRYQNKEIEIKPKSPRRNSKPLTS